MTDSSEAPNSVGSSIVNAANATGLPTTLRGKAQRWIFRLIGGTIGAPLVQESRAAWDQVEGRSKVNMMIAEEVGRRAIADPDLMERAKAHFLRDIFRKQENIEAVAKEAAKLLDDEITDEIGDVDEDWVNIFSRYAEGASSENMRKIWGKILAGEIRKSGSFSPSTMRIISELDSELANDFTRFSKSIVDDCAIKTEEWRRGDLFNLVSRLEVSGLVTGGVGAVNRQYIPPIGRVPILTLDSTQLVVDFISAKEFTIDVIVLTRVGHQTLTLQTLSPVDVRLERLAMELKKHGAVRATLCEVSFTPTYQFRERKLIYGNAFALPPQAPVT